MTNQMMVVNQATATLAAAIATLVVGLVVALIALLQFRVARAKFRLELYERRLKVHAAALQLLEDDTELEMSAHDRQTLMLEGAYLFGRRYNNVFSAIAAHYEELWKVDEASTPADVRWKLQDKSKELTLDLAREARRYLYFGDWE